MIGLHRGRRSWWLVVPLVALALFGAGLISPPVAAATCDVTSLANDGAGTLRAAVNNATCDPIRLTVPGTITLDAGLGSSADTALVIGRAVTITNTSGGTVTLAGGLGSRRVLEITAGNTVGITGVTISGGDPSGATVNGGGILNAGSLTLTNVVITTNTIDAGANGFGGGVANNRGTLTIAGSTISANRSYSGAGVANIEGTLSLTDSAVRDNIASAYYGGGVNFVITAGRNANATLVRVTVSGNTAAVSGGGVGNSAIAVGTAVLDIRSSAIGGNTAGLAAGGVQNFANDGGMARVMLTGTTVGDNTANNGFGGGIANSTIGTSTAIVTMTGGSIADNQTAAPAVPLSCGGGAGIASAVETAGGTATVTMTGVAITGNGGTGAVLGGGALNCGGTLRLAGSTVSGNEAAIGGGVHSQDGTLELVDAIVRNNRATAFTGGVSNHSYTAGVTATATLLRTTIADNEAQVAEGGVTNGADLGGTAALELTDSAITGNKAQSWAGGLYSYANTGSTARATLTNTMVGNNQAQYGGGIRNLAFETGSAILTVTGGGIGGNRASNLGGGVYTEGALATATLAGVAVSGNTLNSSDPTRAGAGVYNAAGHLSLLGGSVVKGNTGAAGGGGILNNAGTLVVTDSTIGGPLPADANIATDDGGGLYQHTAPGTTATATLTRSRVIGNRAFTGGGISNANNGSGTLTLVDTVVDGNLADGGEGSAIINSTGFGGTATLHMTGGSLSHNRANQTVAVSCRTGATLVSRSGGAGTPSATLRGVTVANNTATGPAADAGILNCDGAMLIEDSTISGNTGVYSAGVLNLARAFLIAGVTTPTNASLTIRRSTISGNTANISPGIANIGNFGTGTLIIADSTISGNTAHAGLPGVGSGSNNGGTASATLTNVTIAGNVTNEPSQAAVGAFRQYAIFAGDTATATLTNVTVVGNTSRNGVGSVSNIAGAGSYSLTLRNSILAGNVGGNLTPGDTVTSGGHNVSDDGSGAAILTGPGDLNGADPLLDPAGLANNDGPTQTIALRPASPAVDRVPTAGANCPAADQRAVARPQAVACDSGAYEADRLATALAVAPASDVYGGTATLSATLTRGGVPVANQTITFRLNGTPVGTATTNPGGVATLTNTSLGTIPAGSYPGGVGASFAGNGPYLASSGTAALTVARAGTTTIAQNATATYGNASVTLSATVAANAPSTAPVNEGTVTFVVTRGGQTICAVTSGTVGAGTASATCALGGASAGSATIAASYSGGPNFLPSSDTATLTIQRRILWVMPQDRTVGLGQPNPPTIPPAGCLASQTPTSACWLQLTNGSAFANGDDWADLNLANLRFAYGRTGTGPATERVGATYRITALGALSSNYDLRYQPGTLTVVAAP